MNEIMESWLCPPFDEDTREEVRKLSEQPDELINAFYTRLSFGTGGLRGLMGVGTNRMNRYIVSFTTEGLARYLKRYFIEEEKLKVFIGFDCRHHSKEFGKEAAEVLAGHGIQVFISDEVVTTPFTSFACRELKCHAAIMITASHNPKTYNGYKVYWQDGGQILFPHDHLIEREANLIASPDQVKRASFYSPLIHKVGEPLKKAYRKTLARELLQPEKNQKQGSKIKIVYTSLHGTGSAFVPDLMRECGFLDFQTVKAQEQPDGSFPTVPFPNPEEAEALEMGVKQLLETKGDILIATDPDADRMRVAIRQEDQVILLNGHQIASLLLYHVLSHQKEIPSNGATVKSIVTTELLRKISEAFGVVCIDVLPGFKYIGELIHKWEDGSHTFLFGGEESYGTLYSTFCRDKDGVFASLLVAEAALCAKLKGKNLLSILEEIYQKFGKFSEQIHSIQYPETKEGREEMKCVMEDLRAFPPSMFDGIEVKTIEDFSKKQGSLPLSNTLLYRLEDGSKIVIRPSGTEPKIKIYCEVRGDKNCHSLITSLEKRLSQGMEVLTNR
jgi:phosphoglucomutase/phosphomannomutase